jgi:hypothetical protein
MPRQLKAMPYYPGRLGRNARGSCSGLKPTIKGRCRVPSGDVDMEGGTQMRQEKEGALAEVATVRDTADRLANGEYTEDADHTRVLAGLIRQLAEQVERLSGAETHKGTEASGSDADSDEVPEADATAAKEHVADAAGPRM